MSATQAVTAIGNPTNDAASIIAMEEPYIVEVAVTGSADILFHRWSCDGVEAKAKAVKGSKVKKTDDVESYVYRDHDGDLCIPGENFRGAIILAAKYKQDPRSPRKSAMDLYKAGVIALSPLAKLNGGVKDWEYEHRARVVIQRAAVTRVRPAMKAGWSCTLQFLVTSPEYITPSDLLDSIHKAGQLIGVCDFRPTFGRFQVVGFKVVEA